MQPSEHIGISQHVKRGQFDVPILTQTVVQCGRLPVLFGLCQHTSHLQLNEPSVRMTRIM